MMIARKATGSDAEKISELIYSLMHLFFAEPDGKGAEHFLQMSTPAGLIAFMAQSNINYLLGESDGVFCGVVAVRDNIHLQHLYVAPSFQGRGVGKFLWETARDQAVAAGNSDEFTVNASLNAVPFYKRMGFEAVGDVSLRGGLKFQAMKLIQAQNKSVNAAVAPTGIDWMLQQPLQTGGEAGMSSVSVLQERIKAIKAQFIM
jgi:GNAT superfamily N-acetyltransferase